MRRAVAALAAAGLLACGGDDEAAPDGDLGVVSTTTAGPEATVVAPTAAPPVTTPGPTVVPGETTPAPAQPPVVAEPPTRLEVGGVGSFAAALLRPDLSERLVVEVHADAEPRAASLEHVAGVLGDVSAKPVAVVDAAAPGGGDRAWTAAEIVAAADAGSTAPQGRGLAVVRLLFLRGTFEGDTGVLGVAVRGDVAAVFLDRVEAAAGLLGSSAGVEVAVTTHEVGHLLGLVDLVLDTGRADPDQPGHSRNPGSVMYWAVESDVVGQLLGANPPRDFDTDDRADLARIRAGG